MRDVPDKVVSMEGQLNGVVGILPQQGGSRVSIMTLSAYRFLKLTREQDGI